MKKLRFILDMSNSLHVLSPNYKSMFFVRPVEIYVVLSSANHLSPIIYIRKVLKNHKPEGNTSYILPAEGSKIPITVATHHIQKERLQLDSTNNK